MAGNFDYTDETGAPTSVPITRSAAGVPTIPTDDRSKTDYILISASQAIKSGAGTLRGFFVSAASATPTITILDSTTNGGTKVIDTFTPVAGTSYAIPHARARTGFWVTISGTVSASFFTTAS